LTPSARVRIRNVSPDREGDVRSSRVNGLTVAGVRGQLVAVEAHVGRGLPSLTLTGLPSADVLVADAFRLSNFST